MRRVGLAIVALMAALSGPLSSPARAECEIGKLASMPVLRWNNLSFIEGRLNGHGIRILVNTAAETSLIWGEYSANLGLDTRPATGAAGAGGMRIAKVTELRLGDLLLGVAELPVFGQGGQPFALILGQDLLSQMDVEFDLPNKQFALYRPKGCETSSLAYWPGDYTTAALLPAEPGEVRPVRFKAKVNGQEIDARLHSGEIYSTLTRAAATAAGIKTDAASVIPAGAAFGLEPGGTPRPAVRADSVAIGRQTERNAKLILAAPPKEVPGKPPAEERRELVLGGDFLQSHRVLIAHSQDKIYITDRGLPVFQLEAPADDSRGQAAAMQKLMQEALGQPGGVQTTAGTPTVPPSPLLP